MISVAGGGTKVLVVEDEVLIRMDIVEFLADEGFHPIEAGNADEAMAILEKNEDIECMFTDVNMPGSMDGLALSSLVSSKWPLIRVIISSGMVRPSAANLPAGSVFIAKPYSFTTLLAILRPTRSAVPGAAAL